MKLEYNTSAAINYWKDKDIREYLGSNVPDPFESLYFDSEYNGDLDFNFFREFRDRINWDIQYYTLKHMFYRWNETDQKFFKEFRKEIAICEDNWGEFHHYKDKWKYEK